MVALCRWGQAREDGVAVLSTAYEHLTSGIGILTEERRGGKGSGRGGEGVIIHEREYIF